MVELSDVAQQFKDKMAVKPGTVVNNQSADADAALTAQIEQRMKAMTNPSGAADLEPSPVDHGDLSDNTPSSPDLVEALAEAPIDTDLTIVEAAADSGGWVLPPPAARPLGTRKRVGVEVPVVYESLRLTAKQAGMSSGHLAFSALQAHRDEIVRLAHQDQYTHTSPVGFTKKWQLMWNETELEVLDALVEELAPFLARKSRAYLVSLILERCAEVPPARTTDA